LLWKIFCRKLLLIFLQNIFYKTLFTKNFVGNTCEFYNFVGNNYPRRITCQLKFLEKIVGKSIFLQIFLTNLQENSHVIWEFLVVKGSKMAHLIYELDNNHQFFWFCFLLCGSIGEETTRVLGCNVQSRTEGASFLYALGVNHITFLSFNYYYYTYYIDFVFYVGK